MTSGLEKAGQFTRVHCARQSNCAGSCNQQLPVAMRLSIEALKSRQGRDAAVDLGEQTPGWSTAEAAMSMKEKPDPPGVESCGAPG